MKVSDAAPDFQLTGTSGEVVSLSQFRGRPVVLFFYPKDFTPGCTKEACRFRDAYTAFQEEGAEVIGISSDSEESHQHFAKRLHLSFPLLSDPDGAVRKLYGVKSTLGILPGRVTFVIDKEGIVRSIFSSQLQAERHVEEALRALRALKK